MSISSVDSSPLHVKPEVNLNLSTEANRILFVLNKIIMRAKFVGVIRELVKDEGKLLKDVLEENVLSYVIQQCNKYQEKSLTSTSDILSDTDSPKHKYSSRGGEVINNNNGDSDESVSISEIDLQTERATKADTKEKRKFDGLNEIIYLLEENPEIRKIAQGLEKTLSPDMKRFIKCLIEFKKRMENQLHESAAQFKTREKYMRETYEKNERAKEEIKRLEEELLVTKTDANVCLIGRHILIKRHLNRIDKIQRQSQEAIEKRVNESEKAMVNNWKASVATQEVLKKDLQNASQRYENMVTDHLELEKSLRNRRSKIETQVLGWIQKYDQDIGEKQAEEEKLQALLDEETSQVSEIQKQIDVQDDEYDEIMQEKAEYEEEMLERRLYNFVMNRSARRIQRSYRMYKAAKLAKKLAKKNKKGKKKEKKEKK